MTRLRALSGGQLIKALIRDGYSIVRQRGSHVRLQHRTKSSVTVPYHQIGRGLLRKILRDAQLTIEDLEKLL